MLKAIRTACLVMLCLLFTALASAAPLRVALVERQSTVEISCDDDFLVRDAIMGSEVTMPKGKYFLHIQQGRLQLEEGSSFGSHIIIEALPEKELPKVNKKEYRGSLSAVIRNDRILLNNIIDIEDYLSCVLPEKTMPVWPDEAIKAQAVAARSYALYMQALNSSQDYDISANDEELVYRGCGKRIEKDAVTKLIRETQGQYLADSYGRYLKGVSTSSTGGQTESALAVWNEAVSCLQSVKDYDQDSPEYKWQYLASPVLLQNLLEQEGYKVGKLTAITLSPLGEKGDDRTATGRVRYLFISGSEGTVKISGQRLADILDLNSTLFDVETGTPVPEVLKVPIENAYGFEIGSKDINIKVNGNDQPVWKNMMRSYHLLSGGKEEKITFKGHGKGTGVGLSAWGARGMANSDESLTYADILRHYYPGARLIK